MSERFLTVDRESPYLLPTSVQAWLPEPYLHLMKPLFVEVLALARTMELLNLGKIGMGGSKV